MVSSIELDEPVLADDHPVYPDYLYVADGKVINSPIGGLVSHLKRAVNAEVIQRCDVYSRERMQSGT